MSIRRSLEQRLEDLDARLLRIEVTHAEAQRILDAIKARHEAKLRLDRSRLDAIIEASKVGPVNYAIITEPTPPEPLSEWMIAALGVALVGVFLLVVFA